MIELKTIAGLEVYPDTIEEDGETLSIKDMKLVVAGAINDEPDLINPDKMKDFVLAVMRTTTYNQRALPLWQKVVIMWRMFQELFLGKYISPYSSKTVPNDLLPYIIVAESWVRKQKNPDPLEDRIKLFLKRVRDLFVYRQDSERIDTYGLPGFQPLPKSSRSTARVPA